MSIICYDILLYLRENKATKILSARTVADMLGESDAIAEYSSSAVYSAIDLLLGQKFIARGVRVGNAQTFFITQLGLNHLDEALPD